MTSTCHRLQSPFVPNVGVEMKEIAVLIIAAIVGFAASFYFAAIIIETSSAATLPSVCEPNETVIACSRQWLGTFGVFLIGCVAAFVAFQQKREMRRQSRIQELSLMNEKKRAVLQYIDEIERLLDALGWIVATIATYDPKRNDQPEFLLKTFTKEPSIVDLVFQLHRTSLSVHINHTFDFASFTDQITGIQEDIDSLVEYFEGENDDGINKLKIIRSKAEAAGDSIRSYRNHVSDVIFSMNEEIDRTLKVGQG